MAFCEYCSLKCIASDCECVCHNKDFVEEVIDKQDKKNKQVKKIYDEVLNKLN